MDTKEVGEKLVSLCSKGKNMDAINSLYSKDIVSVEAHGSPEMPAEMKGIDKIRGRINGGTRTTRCTPPRSRGRSRTTTASPSSSTSK